MHKFIKSPAASWPDVWSQLEFTVSSDTGNLYIYNDVDGTLYASIRNDADERPWRGVWTRYHSERMMLKIRLNSTYGNNIEIEKNRAAEIYAEMRKLNAIIRHIEETGGLGL